MDLMSRRNMLMRSASIDWESIARGMIDCTTPFSVDLPSGLTSIREYLFSGTKLTAYTMPTSVTSVGVRAFAGCSQLTAMPIGESVISIGDRAFQMCQNVSDLDIPDSVSSIGPYAFYGCYFQHIVIGSGVTTIGQGCFYACNRLVDVCVLATTPPTLGANAFQGTNDCPIYVPDASVNDYKAANIWSTYASRIFPLSDLNT